MTFRSFMGASALTFACVFFTAPAQACSSCGCDLTSDWLSQGLIAQPGTTFSLRYDYVPQTQLRTGTTSVDRAAIALPASREIEQSTYNHYVTASLDHAFGAKWAVNIVVPFSSRPHQTISPGDTDISSSRTNGLGDVRIVARYQGFGGAGLTGIQFGLKLPTGGFHQEFRSGPSAGQTADRGLQVGTGTTHALMGAYHYGKLAAGFDYVLQLQGDIPLNARDAYRPGVTGMASLGVHYTRWRGITPQLQLNFRAAAQDTGLNADHDNSGGAQLYVAPGLTAAFSKHISAFGIVQLPLYQHVSGYQLAPKVTLSAGLAYKL